MVNNLRMKDLWKVTQNIKPLAGDSDDTLYTLEGVRGFIENSESQGWMCLIDEAHKCLEIFTTRRLS